MRYDYFACNGFCNRATQTDPRYGITEVVLYNPTDQPADVGVTVYPEDGAPITLPTSVRVPSRTNQLLVMPDMDPEVFEDRGHWGARYSSSTPLLINSIVLSGLHHPDPTYQGGVQSVIATELDTTWLYADGVFLQWYEFYHGDTSKAPFPFNELEYYHFLNPNPEPTSMWMTLQYRNREHVTLEFVLPPERLTVWSSENRVEICEPFGVRIVSEHPIATSYVRYIYGLTGKDEWGMHVHFALAGTPERAVVRTTPGVASDGRAGHAGG